MQLPHSIEQVTSSLTTPLPLVHWILSDYPYLVVMLLKNSLPMLVLETMKLVVLNTRISTQLAIRSFLNNRLGTVLDKTVSTNAIPNAIVQLNAIGQINGDLVPPRSVNYFRATFDGGRIQLVNLIPATNLRQGDTVVEPQDSFVLISDLFGQYLILDSTNDANTALKDFSFSNGFEVVSAVTGGGAIGIVTGPPGVGVKLPL